MNPLKKQNLMRFLLLRNFSFAQILTILEFGEDTVKGGFLSPYILTAVGSVQTGRTGIDGVEVHMKITDRVGNPIQNAVITIAILPVPATGHIWYAQGLGNQGFNTFPTDVNGESWDVWFNNQAGAIPGLKTFQPTAFGIAFPNAPQCLWT